MIWTFFITQIYNCDQKLIYILNCSISPKTLSLWRSAEEQDVQCSSFHIHVLNVPVFKIYYGTSLSLLQEQDLRYLVEKIWSRQSILSAWEDIFDLVLSRWDKHQEWSPWNCILLTKDEAAAHDRLVDLEEVRGGSSWSLC